MGKATTNQTNRRSLVIKLLAYAHRYLFPNLVIFLPILSGSKETALFYMGIGLVLLALYNLIGYTLRWKHIFCSYQNAYHQKMTPEHTNWNFIKKSDAYGIPLFFGGLGLIIIIRHFLNL
ncbi:MAG: hypothetical protein J6B95_04100 [Oscillospiraceae bacterium]|nr:hypothetical protein [Oscillospiraceae bacterium]